MVVRIRIKTCTVLGCYFPPSCDNQIIANLLNEYADKKFQVFFIGDINARLGSHSADAITNARGKAILPSLKKYQVLVKQKTTKTATGGSVVDQVFTNQPALSRVKSITVGCCDELEELQNFSDHFCISLTMYAQREIDKWFLNMSDFRSLRNHLTFHKDPAANIGWCDSCAKLQQHSDCLLRFDSFLVENNDCVSELAAVDGVLIVEVVQNAVNFAHYIAAVQTVGFRHRGTCRKKDLRKETDNSTLLKEVSSCLSEKNSTITALVLNSKETEERFFPPPQHPWVFRTKSFVGDSLVLTVPKVVRILKNLRNRKSCGPDEIRPEMLSLSATQSAGILLFLFDIILSVGYTPSTWKISRVVPVFKGKGEPVNPTNYRPISIISVIRKVFESCIFSYLTKKFDISDLQGGFYKGKGTVTNIAILDSFLKSHPGSTSVFLDIRGAFDNVDRSLLCSLIAAKIQNPWLMTVLEDLFRNSFGYLSTNPQTRSSDMFKTYDGTQQGAPLSPLLFNLYLDQLTILLPQSKLSQSNGNRNLLCLFYADDIVIAGNNEDINETLIACEQFSSIFKLQFAPSKCAVLGTTKHYLYNILLPNVSTFKYLGIVFDETGISSSHINIAISKAKTILSKISSSIPMTHLSLLQRCLIVKSFILPHLEYGGQLFCLANVDMCAVLILFRKIVTDILGLPANTNLKLLALLTNLFPPDSRSTTLSLFFFWKSKLTNFKSLYFKSVMTYAKKLLSHASTATLIQSTNNLLGKLELLDWYEIKRCVDDVVRNEFATSMRDRMSAITWALLSKLLKHPRLRHSLYMKTSTPTFSLLLSGRLTYGNIVNTLNHVNNC